MRGPGDRAAALRKYEALVRLWAPRVDLVSPGDLDRFAERHVADSLRAEGLLDLAGEGPCADVGSGAGLPGIPLAIASPDRLWRLIEPTSRRAAVLEEIVRELGLRCEVIAMTAEQAARDPAFAGSHALVTARALARPGRSFELITPLLAPGGLGAVFVGENTKLPEIATEWAPGIAIIRARRA
jgi:16S rRNA (guanine527-N7)-methyltransferase